MKLVSVLAFVTSLLVSGMALAQDRVVAEGGGFYVEPGITYLSSTADGGGKSSGFGILARAGYHLNDAFFIAIDGRYSRLALNGESSYGADAFNWGPAIGVQVPNSGFRVFGGYLINANLNEGGVQQSGNGWRVGAGYQFVPVSVNVEWQDINYAGIHDHAWVGSLSFPFAL